MKRFLYSLASILICIGFALIFTQLRRLQFESDLLKTPARRTGDRGSALWPNSCAPPLDKLVDRYFAPHSQGIDAEQIDDAFIRIPNNEQSIVLVQVIGHTIYVDKSRLDRYIWDNQRFNNVLDRLKGFMVTRRAYCQATHKSAVQRKECEKDFEFVADFKDCQSAWVNHDPFTYANRTAAESLQRYSSLPILTITKCIDRSSIPVLQWFDIRDGKFLEYDINRRHFSEQAFTSAPDARQKKAVFFGTLQLMTTFTTDGQPAQPINKSNWRNVGRTRLVHLAQEHPDMLEVGLQVPQRDVFGDEHEKINSHRTYAADSQARDFRYVVYAEGACGWADRLKTLMLYNSTILLQNTSCSEFYRDLMEPYVHYIPVKGNFDDLVEKISWARNNDRQAADIARNAMALHQECLNVSAIRCYMNRIFDRYSKLTKYSPVRRPGTQVEWQLL